jgi:flagellar hook-associated protein 2
MSSPITLSGFNNIDFQAIVDILIKSEREPINRLETQKKNEQNRLSAYTSLSTNLSSLQSAFAALQASSAFGSLQASSSDTEILTASATASASKGSFTINVTSLARPQTTSSAAGQFSDINATILDGGTLSLTQNGTTTSIDLTGVSTLAQLRDAINAQQLGVKASIINDGSTSGNPPKPFRLVLTSAVSGVASVFTVDDQTSLNSGTPGAVLNLSTNASGVAQDTVFTYNGITIRSASTTVTDAVPGLNLKLLKTGSSIVTVTDDDSVLKDKIKAVVTAFNSFNDFAQGQFKLATDGSSRPPLASDPLLRGINRQLRDFFTSNQTNSGGIRNLTELGVRLTQSGKLEIDDAVLDNALANSRTDVQAFLADTSGFAAKVSNFAQSYTQSGGSIDSVENRIQTTIDSYSNRIQSLETQLVFREQTLNQQFAAADRAISQLNSQGNALAGLTSQFRLF